MQTHIDDLQIMLPGAARSDQRLEEKVLPLPE